ncbi:MAG: hypothetical protein JWM99_2576 [Verrucomicrobiales bacterium]|nr:hypothetical protein [Verrucomicrobiales bacterium]
MRLAAITTMICADQIAFNDDDIHYAPAQEFAPLAGSPQAEIIGTNPNIMAQNKSDVFGTLVEFRTAGSRFETWQR